VQRLFPFRQGDRAEYLAQYILSAIAITVPVPRQEDVGTDFHCSLLERDGDNLRPSLPFNIQIKSHGKNVLKKGFRFGGSTEKGAPKPHEIKQLCQTDTPFLVGLVRLKKQTLDLFTTVTRYFILNNWPVEGKTQSPQIVALMPYSPPGETEINAGVFDDNEKLWTLHLGQPIVSISIAASENQNACEKIKKTLRPYLEMDQENGVLSRIRLGYFRWPLRIQTGGPLKRTFGVALSAPTSPGTILDSQRRVMARFVASLLATYRALNKRKEILQWEHIPEQLLFDQEPQFVRDTIDKAIEFAKSTDTGP